MTDEKRRPRPAAQYGPTAEAVSKNIRRTREQRGLTIYELAAKLQAVGRPVAPSAVAKMERAERQVTVDDLVAVALALNTSPISLLLPAVWGDVPVQLTTGQRLTARTAWRWIRGMSPASDYGVSSSEIVVGPDDDQWEDDLDRDYWQLRQEYDAVTLPPELRRVREHPASRDADAVSMQVERLVRAAGGKAGGKTGDEAFDDQMARTAATLDRLRAELDRLAEERALRRAEKDSG